MKISKKIPLFFLLSLSVFGLFAGCGNKSSTDKQVLALAENILFQQGLPRQVNSLTTSIFTQDVINNIDGATKSPEHGYQFLNDLYTFKTEWAKKQSKSDKSDFLNKEISIIQQGLNTGQQFDVLLPDSVISNWKSNKINFQKLFFDPFCNDSNFNRFVVYKISNGILKSIANDYTNNSTTTAVQTNFENFVVNDIQQDDRDKIAKLNTTTFINDFDTLYNSIYFPSDLQKNIDTTASKVINHVNDSYYILVQFNTSSPFSGITFEFDNSNYTISDIAIQ